MSTRRELLTHLFRLLDERQLPWCVLRNYAGLFDDSSSDVDLLTEPASAAEVIQCCIEAGRLSGQPLIQRTRFVNHSLVFWNGADCFTRIDIDTEKRWRRFHLLTAKQVLASRKRFSNGNDPGFHVPDLRHEAVVVLTQAMWQGKLTGRYAQRLLEIRSQLGNHETLRDVFQQAFGLRENLLAMVEDTNLVGFLQQSARRDCFLRPHKIFHSLGYIFKDVLRLASRKRALPGLMVRLVGVQQGAAEKLAERLAILFPTKKNLLVKGHASADSRRRILFKGGMLVEILPVVEKPGVLLRDGWLQPDRGFAVVQDDDTSHFIHAGTGFMSSSKDTGEPATFICETLARLHSEKKREDPGTFAVLLGLDGSGKTTLARNVAVLATQSKKFSGVRYFHWLPPVGKRVEFPLPEPGNQPRKTGQRYGLIHVLLSTLRLCKNVLRAQLAWWLRLRPLRRAGHLVLVDRYFYNYHLDPASVKYHGPRWLLRFAGNLFPQPDIIITLTAPPEVLLARKQELSENQIREQTATLANLDFGRAKIIKADATQPADVVAGKVMDEILQNAGTKS